MSVTGQVAPRSVGNRAGGPGASIMEQCEYNRAGGPSASITEQAAPARVEQGKRPQCEYSGLAASVRVYRAGGPRGERTRAGSQGASIMEQAVQREYNRTSGPSVSRQVAPA